MTKNEIITEIADLVEMYIPGLKAEELDLKPEVPDTTDVEKTSNKETSVPKIESIITNFLDTVEEGKLPTLDEAETINILNNVLRGR